MKKCVICKEPIKVEGHETCGKVECVGAWAMYPEEYAPIDEITIHSGVTKEDALEMGTVVRMVTTTERRIK